MLISKIYTTFSDLAKEHDIDEGFVTDAFVKQKIVNFIYETRGLDIFKGEVSAEEIENEHVFDYAKEVGLPFIRSLFRSLYH